MKKLALDDTILLQIEKPARYIGNEINAVYKDKSKVNVRFCMCFPDVYEIGMSHLGIQILYDMFNRREDVWCERVYSPWVDLDRILREQGISLFALESQDPIKDFDFLGITLQYEMCYTNVLQILDLSGIPLMAEERGENDPIVIGGGPCACNPEPLADFFDIFYIGEGETRYRELITLYEECRESGRSRLEKKRRRQKILSGKSRRNSGDLCSFPLSGNLPPGRNHCVYGAFESPGAGKGTAAGGNGSDAYGLSRKALSAFYQGDPGSCGSGDSAGMYPGLPLLSGRNVVPPHKRAGY